MASRFVCMHEVKYLNMKLKKVYKLKLFLVNVQIIVQGPQWLHSTHEAHGFLARLQT